ncbi:hypothetical protein G6O67_005069 [Ophiocordyceps sinensis]|uniref:Uncharacterized protein n=1 Tax=Ophiocordyceps sinensis TaxID=72228 RepID=A0A8H4V5H4_9HYPO|nr:hypothetical protein G6O67_005069 [Ophiocordyceps sinensis]
MVNYLRSDFLTPQDRIEAIDKIRLFEELDEVYAKIIKQLHGPCSCRRLEPSEPLLELYLVALLIALAQEQWSILESVVTAPVSRFKAKLLSTSIDGKDIHLYSAESLHIDATAIASEPAGTLRERHEAAPLGHEPGRRGKV